MAEKTKKCRDCLAEIPKKAKKCQHCGSKQEDVGIIGAVVVIGLGVWFFSSIIGTESNKNISTSPTPSETAAKKEQSTASTLCMQRIRASAKFPSSVEFSVLSSPAPMRLQGGGWRIQWAFSAKNSYGNMLPQIGTCDIVKGKVTGFAIRGR